MQAVMNGIGSVLGAVMEVCHGICQNYGWAIILFTLASKVILLPLSIWVHLNGLKMVRLMPEINWLHVNHYGDKDAIAEGQAALYKREKYNPLAGIVPVIVQLILLLGLVDVIRGLIDRGTGAEMVFAGINLGWVPAERGGISLLVPVAAALSALIMCVTQNRSQALQAEQSRLNQIGMLVISVVCSLPFLSPILGPGAVIAQVVGTLLGAQFATGAIPARYALPALFAIDGQVGADFVPVGLSLGESEPETIEMGVPAVLFSRIVTGPLAVLIAFVFSIGLY